MRRLAAVLLACAVTSACSQNMDRQPKYREYEPGPLFRDGRSLQAPVAGTVARGDLERDRTISERPPLTEALLRRGREQFDVFCSPCHGRAGDGNGMIVQRGMPRPPSLDVERLRSADDQHLFDVMTSGYGIMYAYAERVPPQDRWAIVAYIRALQLSQGASLDDLPADERQRVLSELPQ